MEKNIAMLSIGLVCVTSPIIGVMIGGYITDRSGGIQNVNNCLWLAFIFTFSGYIFINFFLLIDNPVGCIFCLWIGIMLGKNINYKALQLFQL